MSHPRSFVGFLLICLFIGALDASGQVRGDREFRGVWIATVHHIDWPLSDRMKPEQQRADFIEILDFYKALDFTAVFVQVRPAGDAFYASELAPWSQFLTGEEGDSGWEADPLDFMIEETHARGMELHAWINPFRVTVGGDVRWLDGKHIFKTHPEWCVRYGRSYYLNPGLPEVRSHVLDVIDELVDNYAIDGIHFDDYYYPYPIKGVDFNDRSAFVQHGLGDFQERENWRRANIDSLMKGVHELMITANPDLEFGVSPFGIWRNRSDDSRAPEVDRAISTYDHLFADPLTWMENGWVDYVIPQLYWRTTDKKASFQMLATWWNNMSQGDVPIYLGNGLHNLGGQSGYEISQQVRIGRSLSNVKGHVFYGARRLMNRPDLVRKLRSDVYRIEQPMRTAD